ncbi:hypothetical protein P9112_002750 [Eukaryota sp. TZLM1-RC]
MGISRFVSMFHTIHFNHPLKGSFLKNYVFSIQSYLNLDQETVNQLFPCKKEKLGLFEALPKSSSSPIPVVAAMERFTSPLPLFIQFNKHCYVPSLPLLSLFPQLLPRVTINPATIQYLQNGANLFSKGVHDLTSLSTTLPFNYPISITLPSIEQPVGVGVLQKRGQAIHERSGTLLIVVNVVGDVFCEYFQFVHTSKCFGEDEDESLEAVTITEELKLSALCFSLVKANEKFSNNLLMSSFVSLYNQILDDELKFSKKELMGQIESLKLENLLDLTNSDGVIAIHLSNLSLIKKKSLEFKQIFDPVESNPQDTSLITNVEQFYLPPFHYSIFQNYSEYFTNDKLISAVNLKRVLEQICKSFRLPEDKRKVIVNQLIDVFSIQVNIASPISFDVFLNDVKQRSKKFYLVVKNGENYFKKGSLENVQVKTTKIRGHVVTVVTNLNIFLLNLEEMANMFKKSFSVAANVTTFQGQEVVQIQGNQVDRVADLLLGVGFPKKHLTIETIKKKGKKNK